MSIKLKFKQIREKMQEITNRPPTKKQMEELKTVLTSSPYPEICECGDRALPMSGKCKHCWEEIMGLL